VARVASSCNAFAIATFSSYVLSGTLALLTQVHTVIDSTILRVYFMICHVSDSECKVIIKVKLKSRRWALMRARGPGQASVLHYCRQTKTIQYL